MGVLLHYDILMILYVWLLYLLIPDSVARAKHELTSTQQCPLQEAYNDINVTNHPANFMDDYLWITCLCHIYEHYLHVGVFYED